MSIKKLLKRLGYFLLFVLSMPIGFLLVSLLLSNITIERETPLVANPSNKTIYLHTNGVHLDIAFKKTDLSADVLQGIHLHNNSQFLSFGWGERNFYLNTPSWDDLTLDTASTALLKNSASLIHLTHYQKPQSDWVAISVSQDEFNDLTTYINQTFKTNATGNKLLLENRGYGANDDFYEANGNYTLFNTCNSWANRGFKQSGLKASYWTPFDFGLLNKYQ